MTDEYDDPLTETNNDMFWYYFSLNNEGETAIPEVHSSLAALTDKLYSWKSIWSVQR